VVRRPRGHPAAVQLRQPDFADVVAGVLAETGLPGNRLCLELTETVVMLDPQAAVRTFQALRGLGVRIALDDFGTGYSSLALLRNLPVDQLKIDRSFLSGYDGPGADPVVATIVSLAASLGLLAVAEGVETPEQLEQLRHLGCPLAQGYLFGRPVPASELVRPRLEVAS
jgi:EAL domain-containing protein (putative c-di-GMP-specific phosphodiesterase class I)